MTKTELRKAITPILRKMERDRNLKAALPEAINALVTLIRDNQPLYQGYKA